MSKLANSKGIHRKFFAAVLICALVAAFSPAMAGKAHADSSRITLYKGQKVKVGYKIRTKVNLKSSKSKVVKVSKSKLKGYRQAYTLQAKKNGNATLTARAAGYLPIRYRISVKNYPAGSEKKPVPVVSDAWNVIKSADGKKQINVKAEVRAGEAAKAEVLALERAAAPGAADESKLYWENAGVTTGRTFYLIKYDYEIVKGYKASKPAELSFILNTVAYDKKWKRLKGGSIQTAATCDYVEYPLLSVSKSSGKAVKGAAGSFYTALFLKNEVKELRSDAVGGISDLQNLGSLGSTNDFKVTGCTVTKLP